MYLFDEQLILIERYVGQASYVQLILRNPFATRCTRLASWIQANLAWRHYDFIINETLFSPMWKERTKRAFDCLQYAVVRAYHRKNINLPRQPNDIPITTFLSQVL